MGIKTFNQYPFAGLWFVSNPVKTTFITNFLGSSDAYFILYKVKILNLASP